MALALALGFVTLVSGLGGISGPQKWNCLAGYTQARYKPDCMLCMPGTYSEGGSGSAHPDYGRLSSGGMCKVCPLGKVSGIGSTSIQDCKDVGAPRTVVDTSALQYSSIGICYHGYLSKAPAATLQACLDRCNANSKCQAAAYCAVSDGCTSPNMIRNDCKLYDEDCYLANSGDVYKKYKLYRRDEWCRHNRATCTTPVAHTAEGSLASYMSGYSRLGRGVCGSGYLSASGYDNTLSACEKRCDDAPTCKTIAYCNECTGSVKNKCAIYSSTCDSDRINTGGNQFATYILYKKNYRETTAPVVVSDGVWEDAFGWEE